MEKFPAPGQLDHSLLHLEIRDAAEKLHAARVALYKIEQNFLNGDDAAHENLRAEYTRAHGAIAEAEFPIVQRREGKLREARTYEDLLHVALWEIEMCGHDTMGSFPIFTGGAHATPEQNVARAQTFINYLHTQGYHVWSQVPYLDMNLPSLKNSVKYDSQEKFTFFYAPLLESGKIKQLAMMDGWEKSRGCRTEHAIAERADVIIQYAVPDGKTLRY